ncbi:Crotonobetainyl-CoA reductase [Paraburkholderia domus]|uniref:Crotonobetainyl-CoA reductase n=1 Tax=Paraburkholderia domus TaxID=2793075 RepID=A0A9N8N7W9_9BURK|nr:acyl-CoA dehydrogenase family protein [Paraburkholderia domus]MBK5063547.1 acyl-CoA dehydrogenase family protein [Burkholderia sp. R-70199]MBK5088462.1 acyl-CoA dehydrogenase family protein [Burkholderia sp. R-69927]MBK5123724.1 acyl-CoA dehydrogenase family protein [Burkholderia sp. R-69980]MBK5169578.1 acyl-CoA dehydrogenase family protein [Burkholderia sp. R-70211]MBK5183647.1 acyl-CoA dehydrogenase family protein [Burkholderia sp. R-69749]MCI0151358.1 acyl-CoA dehydrogenase family prot
MFTEAIEAILRDRATPEAIRAIENGGTPASIWSAVEEAGFLELLTPESAGGAGLSMSAIAPIFRAFGRYAVPVPLAQSIAARALLRDTGVAAPAGTTTLAGACRRREDGSLEAPQVPFGMTCDHVLANVDGDLLLLDAARAERKPCGVHGSLSGTLSWRFDDIPAPLAANGEEVLLFSAAIHAAAIAGAMDRVFAMTLQYCNDRSQFGKSIGKFQAVQHQLSVMAQQVASAGMASELAFSGAGAVPERLATAIAKARTSMAVPLVASTAHALHGAIGVTAEYDLQLFTRRLHEWRMADGSEAFWNRMVGNAALTQEHATIADFVRTAPYGMAA